MPVDYESLANAGSIMGSGGMIVMDESSCMVDVAKYFMDFCMTESCGKCIPCRVGTFQMRRILDAIGNMTATAQDLKMLEELCDLLKHTSLCGLGQSAPNPVLSTLRSFAEEYRAHIEEHKCPAGVCGQPARRNRYEPRGHGQNAEESTAATSAGARKKPSSTLPGKTASSFPGCARWTASPMWAPAASAWSKSKDRTSCFPLASPWSEEGMEVTTASERLNAIAG